MPAQSSIREQTRSRVALTAKVTCRGKTSGGTVVDFSDACVTIQLAYDIAAIQGQSVSIVSEEIGHLTGMVQWARGDKISVRLATSSNTTAKFESYFKQFR